jgi:hypothetical protein
MTRARHEIPPGTLDMLILSTLARSDALHGFEFAEAIQLASSDVLHLEEGSPYPALQRMLIKSWISGTWGRTASSNLGGNISKIVPGKWSRALLPAHARRAAAVQSRGRGLYDCLSGHRPHPPARLTDAIPW